MFNDLPIIICGSGNSIPYDNEKGLLSPLKEIIEDNISIGINYFSRYACSTTFTSFVDFKFYNYEPNREWLNTFPLLIGRYTHDIKKSLNNTIWLPDAVAYFGKDSWDINKERCLYCLEKYESKLKLRQCPKCKAKALVKIGFYHHHFTSLFTLTLAIALGFKKIYLLGLDCCEINGKTHFYQDKVDLKLRIYDGKLFYYGIGKRNNSYGTSTFNSIERTNQFYAPYIDEKDVQIFNVSPVSNIHHFPKISYEQFYTRFNKEGINFNKTSQDEIRQEIKNFINEKLR